MLSECVETAEGDLVAYRWDPRSQGEVLVFLNGLSDGYSCWDEVAKEFRGQHSILQVDLLYQGIALKKSIEEARNLDKSISFEEQGKALQFVLQKLEITRKLNLVGFSYGGGLALDFAAKNPAQIDKLHLWLPYAIRLDRAFPLQRFWGKQFETLKLWPVPGVAMMDHVYENFLHQYMHHRYQNRIPNAYEREIAVRLSESVFDFNAFELFEKIPDHSVYLLTVDQDTLVPSSLYYEYWRRLPKPKKQAWMHVLDGEHLIHEQAPQFLSKWLSRCLSGRAGVEIHEFRERCGA